MNSKQIDFFQGKKIEILEMNLKKVDNRLELSWLLCLENCFFRITFYNVSRLKIVDFSLPLEIHGFEIINHSQNGWENDSAFEIRDFEDDRVNFFCEYIKQHS